MRPAIRELEPWRPGTELNLVSGRLAVELNLVDLAMDLKLVVWSMPELDLEVWSLAELDLVVWRLVELDLVVWSLTELNLVVWSLKELNLVVWSLLELDLVDLAALNSELRWGFKQAGVLLSWTRTPSAEEGTRGMFP